MEYVMSNGKNKISGRLFHGLYAKDVLLPWDDKVEFMEMHADFRAEFFPHGRAEEEIVFELTNLHWAKRTVMRLRTAAILKDPFTADIVKTKKKSWTGIRNALRKQARKEKTGFDEMEGDLAALVTAMGFDMERLYRKIAKSPQKEDLAVLGEKLNSLAQAMREEVMPMIEVLKNGSSAQESFMRAYAPESLEKLIQLEAAIDARIGKVLARLVALKEFKRTPAGGGIVPQRPPVQQLPSP